jgi:hypothetical protein
MQGERVGPIGRTRRARGLQVDANKGDKVSARGADGVALPYPSPLSSLPAPVRVPVPYPRDPYCHCFYKPYRIPEIVPSSTVRSQSQPPTHSCGTLRTRRLVVNVPESDSSKLVPRWLEQIVSERAPSLPFGANSPPPHQRPRAHTHTDTHTHSHSHTDTDTHTLTLTFTH